MCLTHFNGSGQRPFLYKRKYDEMAISWSGFWAGKEKEKEIKHVRCEILPCINIYIFFYFLDIRTKYNKPTHPFFILYKLRKISLYKVKYENIHV